MFKRRFALAGHRVGGAQALAGDDLHLVIARGIGQGDHALTVLGRQHPLPQVDLVVDTDVCRHRPLQRCGGQRIQAVKLRQQPVVAAETDVGFDRIPHAIEGKQMLALGLGQIGGAQQEFNALGFTQRLVGALGSCAQAGQRQIATTGGFMVRGDARGLAAMRLQPRGDACVEAAPNGIGHTFAHGLVDQVMGEGFITHHLVHSSSRQASAIATACLFQNGFGKLQRKVGPRQRSRPRQRQRAVGEHRQLLLDQLRHIALGGAAAPRRWTRFRTTRA